MRYQLLLKDVEGQIYSNDTMAIRLSILNESDSLIIFQELHNVRTSLYGVVNLSIGQGIIIAGSFSNIEWGKQSYLLKTEVDAELSTIFNTLSISSFYGVPYAYHSQTTERINSNTQHELNFQANPQTGQISWNNTYNVLQVYNGQAWICCNQPSVANAGSDINNSSGQLLVQLNATMPTCGRGTWQVWSGSLVEFSDIHNPIATFIGQNDSYYKLKWTVSTGCDSTYDFVDVVIGFSCGHSTVSFAYHGMLQTYGTIEIFQNINNHKCFLDRNLGAIQVATSTDDENSYGDYFQWGRCSDLHELTNSTIVYGTIDSDCPGGAFFYLPQTPPYDWRSPQNNNLWQNNYNSPCPEGWRIANSGDYNFTFHNGISNQIAFESLKLPSAGYRNLNGNIIDGGISGYYWLTDLSAGMENSWQLTFNSFNPGYIQYDTENRAIATPIRCIKDE